MIDNAYMPLPMDDFIETMRLVKAGKLKTFNGQKVKMAVSCPGDCRTCMNCKTKNGKHIFLAIHGTGTQLMSFLRKTTNKVIKHPDFGEILMNKKKSLNARAKEMYDKLLDSEDKEKFEMVKPVPKDRYEFFEIIIKNQENIKKLSDAIKAYAAESSGEMDVKITNKMSSEGLARSVDALMGHFKDEMERATSEGQTTAAEKKWPSLIASVEKAIADAKAGKEPKPSKLAGQHFASFVKRREQE
jgi:hypothetical protein